MSTTLSQDELVFDCCTSSTAFLGFNRDGYAVQIVAHAASQIFTADPSYDNALALTDAIWNAIADNLSPMAALLINSSTGKDSSLMVDTWIRCALKRLRAGLSVPPAVIAMSDTGTEFPEMQSRMYAECDALNRFASDSGLPLEARVVTPPPGNHLLVELLGRGKALPILAKGGKNGKASKAPTNGRGWCMDRVKASPLNQIMASMRGAFPFFAVAVGQRKGESAVRNTTIRDYSDGYPFGLTALKTRPDPTRPPVIDAHTIGVLPVVHWTNNHMAEWFARGQTPWRSGSMAEIRSIYHRAATMDELAGECGLRITKDGSTTSICSDLSGTRMGCWMCLLSVNRSLENFASVDARYEWLHRVHRYIYRHHKRNEERNTERDAMGFGPTEFFPKAFTFAERYWMLMLVLRAQKESGFPLLTPENIDGIRLAWQREGIWLVDPHDAITDMENWRRTGKPRKSYEAFAADAEILTPMFSEGLPSGAYQHLLAATRGRFQPLAIAQFTGLADFATPIAPTLMSYVFRDRENPDVIFVMVSDSPSNIGTKLDRKFFNGTHLGRWRCEGVRPPNPWERKASNGRIFFYRFSVMAARKKLKTLAETPADPRLYHAIALLHENMAAHPGCGERVALTEDFIRKSMISECKGRMPRGLYPGFRQTVLGMFLASEDLSARARAGRRLLHKRAAHLMALIEAPSTEGDEARSEFEVLARQCYDLHEMAPIFEDYLEHWRSLLGYLKAGMANAAVVERLIYLEQLEAVDPDEAEPQLAEFETALLSPAARAA